jgi:SAM-dependent methyltransferase
MKDWENVYKTEGIVQKEVHPFVMEALPLFHGRVLDLGCGTGRHSLFLAAKGFEVVALDASKTGIEILKKRIKDENTKGIRTVVGDMSELPFPDAYFGAVISTNVIHHATFDKIEKTFSEVRRVLEPGGIFAFNVLTRAVLPLTYGREIEPATYVGIEGFFNDVDVPHHFFSKEELLSLLKGFDFVKLEDNVKASGPGRTFWEVIARKA